MSTYPSSIARCQHIKINGTQCGSPALRGGKLCYFHKKWRDTRVNLNPRPRRRPRASFDLPVLEDANSVQIALMRVMRLIASGQIEAKAAGLLLYALQTASSNLRHTKFEPWPHDVVIHPEWVAETGLGENAWKNEHFSDDEGDEVQEEEQAEGESEELGHEKVQEELEPKVDGRLEGDNQPGLDPELGFDPVAIMEKLFNRPS